MRALFAAALVATCHAQTTVVWSQVEEYAMYIGAGVSAHKGATPTFGVATWLNPPVYVEVFNTTDNGGSIFAYNGSSSDASLTVAMARHEHGEGPTANAVDTFALEVSAFGALGTCTVFGFVSTGPMATGSPVWSSSWPLCTADLWDGGAQVQVSSDDAGSVVAVLVDAADNSTADTTAHLYVFDGQTGALRYSRDINASASDGQVAATPDGKWVLFMANTAGSGYLYVLDGMTGVERGSQPLAANYQCAAISADATAVALGLDSGDTEVFAWSQAQGAYLLAKTIASPAAGLLAMEVAFAVGANNAGAVVTAYSTDDFLGARVRAVDFSSGSVVADWSAPVNAALQNNVALKTSGKYIAIALWGGEPNAAPTGVVLALGAPSPIFNGTSPGSMFALDIIVDPSSTPAQDVVYFVVSGKAAPANEFGNGGTAMAVKILLSN